MQTVPVPIALLAILILLALLGLVIVCGVAWATWQLVWEWRVGRKQRRFIEAGQRAYHRGGLT